MMMKKKMSNLRKLADTLIFLIVIALLAGISLSLLLPRTQFNLVSSPTNPVMPAEPVQIKTGSALFQTSAFTPVATAYLPIIQRNPGSTNPPSPAGCNPTNGSGGLAVGTHQTTVAGLNAIVVVGQGYKPQTPAYLGFNIHGDGGAYDMIERSTNPLNQFANQHGWILVSPQSPNGSSWWSNFQGDHKQALVNVFEEMFAKYNLCRNVVFGTTGSGGSEFWTSQFFPDKGGQYPAHTVIACGGNPGNRQKLATLGQQPNIVARSTFHYVYGTADNLVPGILRSIEAYDDAGFRVKVTEIPNAGHCNVWRQEGLPTWHERAAGQWEELATELGVIK